MATRKKVDPLSILPKDNPYLRSRSGRRNRLLNELVDKDDPILMFEAQMGLICLELCERAGLSKRGLSQIAAKIPHGRKLLAVPVECPETP